MKKYIITCIATILGVFFAQADNINVQNVTMDVGQSGTIDICLTNTATNYVSFQMDLYLPDGFTLNKTGNTLSSRFSNGELTIGKQSDGAFRLMGTSLPLNPITGTDGVLITLSVNAPATVTSGTANISNIRFATRQSEKTTMADVSFTMTAIGNQSLSLSTLPTMTYGDAAYTLPSETDQGLSLSWSVDDTSIATVSGNTLTIKGAGSATVTATQAGNNLYNAFSKEYTLTIEKAQLTITAKDATMVYGGELPAFEATYDGFKYNEDANVLTKQPSFNSSATSSSAIGTYDINVSGAEAQNYTISYVKGTLTITAKGASNLTIGDIAEQTYTGSAITPAVTVKDGSKTLTSGTDYTIAFSNNVNVGTATVTITGKGNYTGTKTATFTINAKAASNLTISSIAAQTYTGSALTPAVTVKDGSTTLTSGTDYTVAYSDNTNAGTATVTVTGKGNYTGTKTATFTINAKAASNLTISSITTQTYTGSALTPAVTVKDGTTTLTSGTDYTVAYSNNTNAGTATVTITGKGNYTGTKTATFTINAKAASNLTISSIASQTYTGSALTPAVTVKDGTTTLTSGTDYTVAYSNNTNAGTATVTVTGKGNYTGTKTATFTINAKAASNFTISEIAAVTYNGSAQTPTVTVKDGSTTLTSGTDYTVAYSNNTNAGTATVTVTGKGNYTGTKTVTYTINAKAASNLTISNIAVQTYTGSAITPSITVKDGSTTLTIGTDYTIAYSNNTNVGTATVTVTGKGNYSGAKTTTFTIAAKDISGFTMNDIVEQTYTGSAITPAVTVNNGTTALTNGTDYTIQYSDNINVGTATVTVTGKGNYSGTETATFTIGKAPLTIKAKDATMVFGGELPVFEVTYDGFVNSEDVSVLTKQPTISTEATSSSPSGTYAIIASGAEAQNYAISYVNGTLTIGKRTQTITLDDNLTMTYGDGTFTLPEETEQGLLIDWSSNNATVAAVVGNTLMVKGAGTATLTAEQEGDNNNQPMTKDITLTVNKAPLTVTSKSYTIEQGQSLPTFAATYEGFVNNQTANVLTKQPTFSCEAANSDVPGTYAITASGAEAKNYEMSYVAGTLTITRQADVTVKAQSYTIKYGDELPEFEYTTEGAELTGTPLLSCEATSASPVGTYPITVSKGSVENYNVTYVAGTLTIEKASLTVKAQDATMTYGEALPSFDASYEGFKNNDDATVLTTAPTMTTVATPASAVGTYEITANGAEAQNYEMNYVKGTLTISKAALTVTPKNASMTYGDVLPTFEVTYEGFKNNDDASVLTTLPSMTTAATPSSTVGTYEIAADGAEAENYVISYGSCTLTVEKAPLTITAQNYTMKQRDPLPAFDATFEGFKNNETSSVLTKQPKFGCEATSASEPGTYDINVSGAEAQNYEMSYVKGTITVTQADPVTITAESYTIKYGDELPEFDFTSEGAELTGTPLLSCEATSASPVGTYPITVTKGSVENYNVTYVAGTLTIEKAPLTITAQSYTMVQGEEFPEFEALYDGFKNGETESALKRKPQLATLADEYSGPGEYEIFVSGARSDNYDITYVNGTLTIEANSGIATYIAKIPGSSVVLRSKNGEITVEGLTDGQRVSIHTYGGMLIGTATTVDGKATINTSLTPGSIVIVRVGNKTVKYVVR